MPENPAWLTFPGAAPPAGVKLEPEYRDAYTAWKATPSPAAAGRMLVALKPVITTGVKAFGGAHPNPMLRSRAKQLALNALHSYEPTSAPLKNHVLSHMQGLQRYAARQTRALSVSEATALDRQRLMAAENELKDLHGHEPSTTQLADHTGMSTAHITRVRRYQPGMSQGQASPPTGDEDEGGGEPAVEQPDPVAAKLAFIYHDLDPTSQTLAEYALGLHGRPKLRHGEIARRLNLSQGAISQRAKRIQDMIDSVTDSGIL